DEPDQRKLVSKNIAVVIRTAVDMGASYPDIAQMILQAHQQGNIEGQVEIDALPEGGRMYYRPVHDDSLLALKSGDLKSAKPKPKKGSRVGNQNMVPNIFTTGAPSTSGSRRSKEESEEPEIESASESGDKGKATLIDSRKPESTDEDDKFVKQNTFQSWFRYFYK
ncbi:MAG TPA: hypothetical protein DCY03_20525, partial [Planctomycetaceae bacterium]|nr:hypothetical protein [Planctomycetaceae bacterium]